MGLEVSQEHWDTGLIPSPAQWVKDQALPHLQCWMQLQLRSDLGQKTLNAMGRPQKKKKNDRVNGGITNSSATQKTSGGAEI